MKTTWLALVLLLLQSPAALACSSCVSSSGTETSLNAYKGITLLLGGVPMLFMAAFIIIWRYLQRQKLAETP